MSKQSDLVNITQGDAAISGTTGQFDTSLNVDGPITSDGLTVGTAVYPTSGPLSNRNKIINGAMVIDQRNAGASVSGDGSFAVDRFNSFKNTGTYTGQQSSDAPAGFTKSYIYTNTSATTTTYASIAQIIEGNNVADLNWGASSAQTVTLSFWVKCSLTGTFGVSLRNSASDRSYVASYTINSADTWEYKTVTIAGDTSGTWLTTNGAGIRVWWDLGVGAGGSTTAGSWQAGNFFGLTGGVKLTETNGATFYITGVQLEAGDTATPFEHRSYGQELALCQRYYERDTDNGSGTLFYASDVTSGSVYYLAVPYKVTKRAVATVTISNTSNFNAFSSTVSPSSIGVQGFRADCSAVSTASGAYFRAAWEASAEL